MYTEDILPINFERLINKTATEYTAANSTVNLCVTGYIAIKIGFALQVLLF